MVGTKQAGGQRCNRIFFLTEMGPKKTGLLTMPHVIRVNHIIFPSEGDCQQQLSPKQPLKVGCTFSELHFHSLKLTASWPLKIGRLTQKERRILSQAPIFQGLCMLVSGSVHEQNTTIDSTQIGAKLRGRSWTIHTQRLGQGEVVVFMDFFFNERRRFH